MEASLFVVWGEAFNQQNPAVQIAYVPTSSAEGIRRVGLALGDFAAGEIRLPEEVADPSHMHLVRIPIAVMGVVPIYNLPGAPNLKLTRELLAQIYSKSVVRWNDPRIAILNPGVVLPDVPITAIDREPGSGIRYIFDEFLSKSLGDYRSRRHQSEATTGGGSVLMVQSVAFRLGAIGYIASTLQEHHGVAQALVRNSAGKFVRANPASIYAACAAKAEGVEKHLEASLVDAPGVESYPIVGLVWIYLPNASAKAERTEGLRQFTSWALNEGQRYVGLGLLPLPKNINMRSQAELEAVLR